MKTLFLVICFLCFYNFSFSQTPSVSVKFRLEEIMYHGVDCPSTYSILFEQCNFRKANINFSHDTSKIDWNNLPKDISRSLNCEEVNQVINQAYITDYYYSKHDFVFENIFKINVYRDKCGLYDTMVISFPITISSFITMIDFGKLYFYPGNYNLTGKIDYELNDKDYLIIKPKDNILPK